ncbi:MAG TPA: hypothetical protein VGK59_01495 [Ohtaekwangia sp.]
MSKKISLVLLIIPVLLLSCSFSAGTKKDLANGLSHSYNGFTVEEAFLVGSDNTVLLSNKVPLNSQVAIVVQGIGNYVLKDDKAFPGLSLTVTDLQKTPVLDEADLFAGTEGYSVADASVLRGTVTVADPMKAGQTYHIKMRIWDKNNPENEITSEVDIEVQ